MFVLFSLNRVDTRDSIPSGGPHRLFEHSCGGNIYRIRFLGHSPGCRICTAVQVRWFASLTRALSKVQNEKVSMENGS